MNRYRIVEEYDGRLPVFNVIKEVEGKYQIIKSFDSYNDAERFMSQHIEHIDSETTYCGEEDPCN